jgi:hypothetical protein
MIGRSSISDTKVRQFVSRKPRPGADRNRCLQPCLDKLLRNEERTRLVSTTRARFVGSASDDSCMHCGSTDANPVKNHHTGDGTDLGDIRYIGTWSGGADVHRMDSFRLGVEDRVPQFFCKRIQC